LSTFALETTGGHGASTLASVYHRYLLLTKQMRDSGLPADVLVGKLKKDTSFALRQGTIAQVTTHHHALDGCAWLRLATPGYACPARARPPTAPRMRSSSLLPSTGGRRATGRRDR
jgi:hypothetical protein